MISDPEKRALVQIWLFVITPLYLVWFIWYTIGMWYRQSPIPPPSAVQTSPPCTDANWSAGSAFFTLTALTIGYIAHPRGCLVWNRSGRMWRLSPVFALIEACFVFERIIQGLLWANVSFPVVCHTLMAVRIGNSWQPSDIKAFLKKMDDHTDEETGFGSNGDGNEMAILNGYRHIGHLPPEIEREYHRTCDKIFQEHLNLVRDFERGPSFRVFIWLPMILQVMKLAIVDGSGAIFTQIIGWIYFGAWLSIEILMITISQRPLTARERLQATSLSRRWRKSFETPDLLSYWLDRVHSIGFFGRWMNSEILPPSTFRITRYSALSVAMLNWGMLWTFTSASSKGENHEPGTYLSLFECTVRSAKMFGLCLATMTCGLPLLLQQLLHLAWKILRSVLWFDIGSLWFEDSVGDLEPLWPGHIAVCSYVLTFLYYSGIWWTEPFDCWTTTKPSYYDWLG